jgi:hypothetical protein
VFQPVEDFGQRLGLRHVLGMKGALDLRLGDLQRPGERGDHD